MNQELQIIQKMQEAGLAKQGIDAFLNAYRQVMRGATGLLPESALEPVSALPELDISSPFTDSGQDLLNQLVVIKLNGGLGTSMGLDLPKSLIPIKGQDNFLDFMARQILHLRSTSGAPNLAFYLMNSFNTREASLNYLAKYPELASQGRLDFLQGKVPKISLDTKGPVTWPSDPSLEWCPPGHGDLYPSLVGCGLLDELLAKGINYLFVSNADNLGATVDLRLLHTFAESGLSFLMEVARRTPADRKGGHLAVRKNDGRLLLRESAQCPEEDVAGFQDISRHRFFNTNNLWVRLDVLQEALHSNQGVLPLPLITNHKTVDPRDPTSPRVVQIECAMGAAIECFDKAGAMVVPRSRFSPVKTTSDLLALRSDAYVETEDHRLALVEERQGQPPVVKLDSHFQYPADFERRFPNGPPSLKECHELVVEGDVVFGAGVVCRGKEVLRQTGSGTRHIAG